MMGGTGNGNDKEQDDFVDDDGMQETVVMQTDDEDIDTVADTAEVNVEELVAKIDSGNTDDLERRKAIKKKLERMQEEIGDNLDGTYNINLDDD
ncbi:MAG: hypothetical protein QNI99_18080 [Woeseiaceae bacterium]|nr:hypothetical protein [Woeseiaceae bacterium]